MSEQTTVTDPRSVSRFNNTGSTISKGYAVKETTTSKYVELAGDTELCTGILANDIPDGEWGLVYVDGAVPCFASAALTVGSEVGVGAGGKVNTASSSDRSVGVAVTAGGTNALAIVQLNIGNVVP
jgi:hypothetical protein